MTETAALRPSSAKRAQQRRRVRVMLPAERVLRGSTVVEGELTGPFDFVFLDADRRQYPAQLPLILSRLTPNALLLADNVHSHPQEIAPYLEAISAHGEFEHVVIGVGKGLSVALKRA